MVPAHIGGVVADPVLIPAGQSKGVVTVRFVGARQGPFNMPLTVRATLSGKGGPLTAESKLEIAAP